VVEKNRLRVTLPESIKGTYDSAIGNFGIPQYGVSMAGTVLYHKDNRKGCKEFTDYDISFKKKPGASKNKKRGTGTNRRAVESYWRSRMIYATTFDEDKVTPVYKLEEILLKNLEFLYDEAISKLVALGDDEDVSLKAVLRNAHCCGGTGCFTNERSPKCCFVLRASFSSATAVSSDNSACMVKEVYDKMLDSIKVKRSAPPNVWLWSLIETCKSQDDIKLLLDISLLHGLGIKFVIVPGTMRTSTSFWLREVASLSMLDHTESPILILLRQLWRLLEESVS